MSDPKLISEDDFLALHAYADGELDAAASLRLQRKIAASPALAAQLACIAALQGAIAGAAPVATASAALHSRLEIAAGRTQSRATGFSWRPVAMAASLVAVLALGAPIANRLWQVPDQRVAQSLQVAELDSALAGHLRGLAAGRPFDVESTDRHTVKPWFDGRLSFAPQVIDLADQGFALAGGRIDIIFGKPAATSVYRHLLHVISLTQAQVAQGQAFVPPVERQRDGFAIISWSRDGFSYVAISDLPLADARAFASAWRAKAENP